jgi:hypothetical protein
MTVIISQSETCDEARSEIVAWLVSRARSERGMATRSRTRRDSIAHEYAAAAFEEAANFCSVVTYADGAAK